MALSIDTAEKLSTLPFLAEIDRLKAEVMALRPLSADKEGRVMQKFRLDWNYHSNAIEGNQLTYGETVAFLKEGLTAKGKPFKDHLDIKGHDEAINYLLSLVKDKDYSLNESEVRNLHTLTLKENYFVDAITDAGLPTRKEIKVGQYKTSPNHVQTPTGEIHYYASPEHVPMLMGDLMEWYNMAKDNPTIHPVVLAALFHHEFTAIHPFDDGNGRMGRLLMNLMLMQDDYLPIVVKQGNKTEYYQVLRQADAGEMIPLTEYIADLVKHSLSIYIKAAKGESFEEEDDIDKEIALFKKSLREDVLKHKKDAIYVEKVIKETIIPFFNMLIVKLKHLDDLFVEVEKILEFNDGFNNFKFELESDGFINHDLDSLFSNYSSMNNPFLTVESKVLYSLSSFKVYFLFNGFTKRKIPTNISLNYLVSFQEFNYYVTRQNAHSDVLQDVYGQNKSKEELTTAVANEVKYFMEQLKQYV